MLTIRRHGRTVLLSPLHGPLLLTAGVLTALLICPRTPAVYRYTWMPVLVIAAVYASVALIAVIDYARARSSPLSRTAAALVLIGVTAIPVGASVLNLRRDQHKNAHQMARMRTELAYACPGEPVLDGTAFAVFRPSAYHFEVLVQGLRSWIAAGVISEQMVLQELYQARAPVADPDHRLHALGRDVDGGGGAGARGGQAAPPRAREVSGGPGTPRGPGPGQREDIRKWVQGVLEEELTGEESKEEVDDLVDDILDEEFGEDDEEDEDGEGAHDFDEDDVDAGDE